MKIEEVQSTKIEKYLFESTSQGGVRAYHLKSERWRYPMFGDEGRDILASALRNDPQFLSDFNKRTKLNLQLSDDVESFTHLFPIFHVNIYESPLHEHHPSFLYFSLNNRRYIYAITPTSSSPLKLDNSSDLYKIEVESKVVNEYLLLKYLEEDHVERIKKRAAEDGKSQREWLSAFCIGSIII